MPEAEYNLGMLYARGVGVEQNYEKAFELYQKASLKGMAEAQGNLGVLYSKGNGVAQDYKKAFFWFTKAANSGVTSAQTDLALLYDETNNKAQAEKWYRVAAAKGEKVAQYYLGKIFYKKKITMMLLFGMVSQQDKISQKHKRIWHFSIMQD